MKSHKRQLIEKWFPSLFVSDEMIDAMEKELLEAIEKDNPINPSEPEVVTPNTLWNKYRSRTKLNGKFRMDVDSFFQALAEYKSKTSNP